MIHRLANILAATALFVQCVICCGCSKKAAAPGNAGGATGMGLSGPGDADCYDTARSVACPPDATDPSGSKLPAPGGLCTLPRCKPCGSATAPAYRDSTGAAQAGWCLCVPKSDDSGIGIYSCFSVEQWRSRTW